MQEPIWGPALVLFFVGTGVPSRVSSGKPYHQRRASILVRITPLSPSDLRYFSTVRSPSPVRSANSRAERQTSLPPLASIASQMSVASFNGMGGYSATRRFTFLDSGAWFATLPFLFLTS